MAILSNRAVRALVHREIRRGGGEITETALVDALELAGALPDRIDYAIREERASGRIVWITRGDDNAPVIRIPDRVAA